MAELVIGFGKEKASKGKDLASEPMGDDPVDDKEDLDEADAALEDAFEALKADDKVAFKDAMSAAIAAKCADMAGESAPESKE
jgi:hypothetical protein